MVKDLKCSRGFTLLELLVMIGIVAIISSIILLALGPVRAKARDVRVMSGVRQLKIQIESDVQGNEYGSSFTPVANNFFLGNISSSSTHQTLLEDIMSNAPQGISECLATYTQDSSHQYDSSAEVILTTDGIVSDGAWTKKPERYSIWGRISSGGYFCMDSGGNTRSGTYSVPNPQTSSCF